MEALWPSACAMPLLHSRINQDFLTVVRSLVLHKREFCGDNTLGKLCPGIYTMWSLSSNVTCELVADAVNESGCFGAWCNDDPEDDEFGSRGCAGDFE